MRTPHQFRSPAIDALEDRLVLSQTNVISAASAAVESSMSTTPLPQLNSQIAQAFDKALVTILQDELTDLKPGAAASTPSLSTSITNELGSLSTQVAGILGNTSSATNLVQSQITGTLQTALSGIPNSISATGLTGAVQEVQALLTTIAAFEGSKVSTIIQADIFHASQGTSAGGTVKAQVASQQGPHLNVYGRATTPNGTHTYVPGAPNYLYGMPHPSYGIPNGIPHLRGNRAHQR